MPDQEITISALEWVLNEIVPGTNLEDLKQVISDEIEKLKQELDNIDSE